MDTSHFLPPGRTAPQPGDLLRLVQNCLARACMDTRFKKLVGWRGFAPCPDQDGAATCRLTRRPGVYGLAPAGFLPGGGASFVRFVLHYFPHIDEPLFESLSPAAALRVATDDYRAAVRNFCADPALNGPFAIAGLTVGLANDKHGLVLALDTCEQQCVLSEPGIADATGSWVVPPGGVEQDIPALALARDFFDVLGAAASQCVGEPPCAVREERGEPYDLLHATSGAVIRTAGGGNAPVLTTLAWGDADLIDAPHTRLPDVRWSTAWRADSGRPVPADLFPELCWRTHDLDGLLAGGAHPAAADRRPGLIVLCGYLGSGKTTLVNQIIEHHRNHDAFVAVIQNEIGATGVDAHLVEESESVESLDEGCVCCTLAGSLAKGAQRLIDRYHPERIVLETTGLANPLNLLDELSSLSDLVRLDVIVTVVDAVHVRDALATSNVARDQIRGGEVLVLNKCDLVDQATLEMLRAELRGLNHRAPILETSFARVHPAMLLGDIEPDLWPRAAVEPSGHDQFPHGHDHHGDEHHHHHHATHGHAGHEDHHRHGDHLTDGFAAVRVPQPPGVSQDELFELIAASPGPAFRVKGIVELSDADGPEALQCVGDRREVTPLPSVYDGPPFLIFIGQNLDEHALRDYWTCASATCWARQGARQSACSCPG